MKKKKKTTLKKTRKNRREPVSLQAQAFRAFQALRPGLFRLFDTLVVPKSAKPRKWSYLDSVAPKTDQKVKGPAGRHRRHLLERRLVDLK